MATLHSDAFGTRIDGVYRPSANEEFMNPDQIAYFRQKLMGWKDAMVRESRETMTALASGPIQEADLTDRASSETDWAIHLRTRDRQRKLIAKIDSALRRIDTGEYGFLRSDRRTDRDRPAGGPADRDDDGRGAGAARAQRAYFPRRLTMKVSLAGLLILFASPAAAGTPLWQNIEEGMTAPQVRALYPAAVQRRDRIDIRDYRPLPSCPSTVRILFEDGLVHAVQVRGAHSILGLCATEVEQALRARYGEPVDADYEAPTLLTSQEVSYIWVRDAVVMRFRNIDDRSWIMEYVSLSRLERERTARARIGL